MKKHILIISITILSTLLSGCTSHEARLAKAREALAAGDYATAEEQLGLITESDKATPSVAEAYYLSSRLYSATSRYPQAAEALKQSALKGWQPGLDSLIVYMREGKAEYGIAPSDKALVELGQQLRNIPNGLYLSDLNQAMVDIYLFSPEARNPLKAVDIINSSYFDNVTPYRYLIQYMGVGGTPQDLRAASKLLDCDPLPETALFMGHLAMHQLLRKGDYPEKQAFLALKYYRIALEQSRYADTKFLTDVIGYLRKFVDDFNSRTVGYSPRSATKRTISGGWYEYYDYSLNGGFNYCGGITGNYNTTGLRPSGFGVGSWDNENVFCGYWRNGAYDRGVKYESNGDIFIGTWGPEWMTSGYKLSADGNISYIY